MNTLARPRAAQLLAGIVEKSAALTGLLVSKEGVCVASAGNTGNLNTTALAALVAGMFSATREVARMVGEQQFSILLQQGETRNIHISLVNDQVMMVVVFEDFQHIGRVRHVARQGSGEIAQALTAAAADRHAEISAADFREFASSLIDRIFDNE